jgi:dynein heavy chain
MPRLIITPITERILRTIFLGLHMSYAISLEGAVSTGKTETTKEFARLAGKMCFVFHCSNSITSETLIKFFKGIVSGGSWTCLDEFNRVPPNVISVISQVILNISSGIRALK